MNRVVEEVVVIKDTFISVLPLTSPVRRMKNVLLERELLQYGKLIFLIKWLMLEFKAPETKHVAGLSDLK